jgi:hypothetical protein
MKSTKSLANSAAKSWMLRVVLARVLRNGVEADDKSLVFKISPGRIDPAARLVRRTGPRRQARESGEMLRLELSDSIILQAMRYSASHRCRLPGWLSLVRRSTTDIQHSLESTSRMFFDKDSACAIGRVCSASM